MRFDEVSICIFQDPRVDLMSPLLPCRSAEGAADDAALAAEAMLAQIRRVESSPDLKMDLAGDKKPHSWRSFTHPLRRRRHRHHKHRHATPTRFAQPHPVSDQDEGSHGTANAVADPATSAEGAPGAAHPSKTKRCAHALGTGVLSLGKAFEPCEM